MASTFPCKIKGYITITRDYDGQVITIENTVNVPALVNVLARLLGGSLPNQNAGNSEIILNGNTGINVTVSVSGTTITWSGTLTLTNGISISSLALYPVVYEGSNSFQFKASSVSLSTPIQLNQAGTYTFTWTWEFVTDQSQGLIPSLLVNSFQNNLKSVSVAYDVNGTGASGTIGTTTNALFFIAYIQSASANTTVTSFSVTVTLTLNNTSTATTITLSANIVPTTVTEGYSFLDFITIFIV